MDCLGVGQHNKKRQSYGRERISITSTTVLLRYLPVLSFSDNKTK